MKPAHRVTYRPWKWSAAIFIVALFLRLIPLALYVTPDEPIWVLRSVQFADALSSRRWADIPQTGHPGLSTMALGALGIRLTQMVHPVEAEVHLAWIRNMAWLAPENGAAFSHLAFFLPAGRALVAFTTSLGVVLAYCVARPRLGATAAHWLALFLALDPFLIGHSGLLHTDALQAMSILLATLLVLPRSGYETRTPALLGAACCLALAGLTKTLGLLAGPGLAVLVLSYGRRSRVDRLAAAVLLTLATAGFIAIAYPPLWFDPARALKVLVGATEYHSGIGLRDSFFAGRVTTDPGPLFYPVVLLFRLTPPVLVGVLGIGLRKRRAGAPLPPGLWMPALTYLMGLTMAAKKFDRYALTLFPLAAIGAARFWAGSGARWRRIALATLLIPWALIAITPLFYSNPLLGGPWVAQTVIPLGWGEASGLAARAINQHLDAPSRSTLMAANVTGAAAFFEGETLAWDQKRSLCVDALIGRPDDGDATTVLARNVTVAGIHLTRWTTQSYILPSEIPVLLAGRLPGIEDALIVPRGTPLDVQAWLNAQFRPGDRFLWLHLPDCYPLAETQLRALLHGGDGTAGATCVATAPQAGFPADVCTVAAPLAGAAGFRARFAGSLDLVTASWPERVQAPTALTIHGRWSTQVPLGDLRFQVALRDQENVVHAESGNLLLDSRGWPTSRWHPGEIIDGDVYLPLPLHLAPGTYTIVLSFSDPSGQLVSITRFDGSFAGTRFILGDVTVQPARYPAQELDLPLQFHEESSGLTLVGAAGPPPALWAGEPLPFRLGWERGAGEPPMTFDWELACEQSEVDRGSLVIAPITPATWPIGHRYVGHYAPRTSPYLPGGLCSVAIWLAPGHRVEIGELTVIARSRRFELPVQPQTAYSVGLGSFARLVGHTTSPADSILRPGDPLEVTLFFVAERPADQDFTVFVHLIGSDGRVWAQSDAWPEAGSAPTTSWIAGQVVADTHRLTLATEAPAGFYTLVFGLYEAQEGERVVLVDEQGHAAPGRQLSIGSFQVVP